MRFFESVWPSTGLALFASGTAGAILHKMQGTNDQAATIIANMGIATNNSLTVFQLASSCAAILGALILCLTATTWIDPVPSEELDA